MLKRTLLSFKKSIFNKQGVIEAFFMKQGSKSCYTLLLTLLLILPLIAPISMSLNIFKQNGNDIIQSIPNFNIENGSLQTENTDSFINKTDTIIYAYDPEGHITDNTFQEISPNVLHIKTEKTKMLIALQNQQFQLPYSQVPQDSNAQRDFIHQLTHFSMWLVFGVLLIFILLGFVVSALLLAMAIKTLPLARSLKISFSRSFYLALIAMTTPTVLLMFVSFLSVGAIFTYFPLLPIIGYMIIRYIANRIKIVELNPKDRDQEAK